MINVLPKHIWQSKNDTTGGEIGKEQTFLGKIGLTPRGEEGSHKSNR